MFIARLINAPEVYVPLVLIVIFSICAHELMHAWTALKQGDDTAARLGHLTLNPLKQMGVTSLIMLAFVGVAWALTIRTKVFFSNLSVSPESFTIFTIPAFIFTKVDITLF